MKQLISDFIDHILVKVLLLLILFTTLSAFAKDDHITIAGSTTILPVSEKLAKVFHKKTGIKVSVHGGGSTGGIKAAKLGTADIGASSRDLNPEEKSDLEEIAIGKDALAIIVNKSNPVSSITLEQARGIFAGRIKNWKELGGLDKPIQPVNRESGSGTRELFTEIVMKILMQDKTEKFVPMTLSSIVNNSNAELKETIKLVSNAIGYVSVGFTDDTVKILKINSVFPTKENILSEKYPLVRNLYYLVKKQNKNLIRNFLEYVLSKEGQELIVEEGFFPVNASIN